MADLLIDPLPGESPSKIQRCRTQNQRWATKLADDEREIDQLQSMLADWPEEFGYRHLQHRAVDYTGSLNLLRFSVQRVRDDMVCERIACPFSRCQTCNEPRFGMYPLIEGHVRPLTDEFSRVRDGCNQFLSGIVALNLI